MVNRFIIIILGLVGSHGLMAQNQVGSLKAGEDSVLERVIVYVTSKGGLNYRAEADIKSQKLGTFEYGSKLLVTREAKATTQIEAGGKIVKGKWVYVKARYDSNHKHFTGGFPNEQFKGYVFNAYVLDSANAVKQGIKRIDLIGQKDLTWASYKQCEGFPSLDLITQEEFESYRSQYLAKKLVDQNKSPYVKDHCIEIPTRDHTAFYFCDAEWYTYFQYRGKLESTNTYFVEVSQPKAEESMLLAIDGSNGEMHELLSELSSPGTYPLPSPDLSKLIIFHSQPEYFGDRSSQVSIYKRRGNTFDFERYDCFLTTKWYIKDMAWIDNETFVMSTYEKTVENEKGEYVGDKVEYLKVRY